MPFLPSSVTVAGLSWKGATKYMGGIEKGVKMADFAFKCPRLNDRVFWD